MIFSILRDGFCSFSLFAWFRVDMTNWLKSQLKPIRQTVNAKYKYNICTPICEFIKDHLYQVTNQWRFYLIFTTFWETGSMRTFVRQTSITQRSLLPLAHRMIIQWWIQDFSDGGGGTNPQSDIASLPIIWPILPRQLHENERNWTKRRRGHVPMTPPGPANEI